jgi:hypothetical protein
MFRTLGPKTWCICKRIRLQRHDRIERRKATGVKLEIEIDLLAKVAVEVKMVVRVVGRAVEKTAKVAHEVTVVNAGGSGVRGGECQWNGSTEFMYLTVQQLTNTKRER